MKKNIRTFFQKHPQSAFKNKEIASQLNISNPEDYALLKSTLYTLYKEEFLSRKGKRYQLNQFPDSNKTQGILQLHHDGYGFVVPKKKKFGDVFISERNVGPAFDGDTVEVVLFAKHKEHNLEGQIIKVLERKRKEVIGTLHKSKSFYFISPDDLHLHRDIYIHKTNLKNAKQGDKVIVGNIEWDSSMLNPEGVVLEVLGKEGTTDAETATIAKELNLQINFSANAVKEAD